MERERGGERGRGGEGEGGSERGRGKERSNIAQTEELVSYQCLQEDA